MASLFLFFNSDDQATAKLTVLVSSLKQAGITSLKFGEQAKAGGGQAKESMGGVSAAVNSLKGYLVGLVGAAAIKQFFQESIADSLLAEEALRKVGNAVEATGSSFSAQKEKILAFAAAQQAFTRFSDDETLETMSRFVTITGSVGQAMAATTLAQNMASYSGKSLGEATGMLTGLFSGHERSVMMIRREYSKLIGDAKTTQEVLSKIDDARLGLAHAA